MHPQHDHEPAAACRPSCPGWAEGALYVFAFQRRYPEMLEACRTAEAIELVDVAPDSEGVVLPDYLKEDPVVRLTLVVGRDTPEVFLDEWGIRCTLTFRSRRHDCALPWPSVLGGVLRPPPRTRRRFGVVAGAAEAGGPEAPAASAAPGAPRPAAPVRFGVIEGGKGKPGPGEVGG